MSTSSLSYDRCRKDLASVILAALETKLGLPQEANLSSVDIFAALEKPPELTLGDYALPCFRFAKILKKSPQQIATALQQELTAANLRWYRESKIVGAFLNIFLRREELVGYLLPEIIKGDYFTLLANQSGIHLPLTMIEFSQPNTHKEFHVGHARNAILGDALVRIHRFCGYKVIAANYPGDEGAHIAKCLWFLQKQNLTPPSEGKGEWLGEVYTLATKALDNADNDQLEVYKKEISSVLRAIEQKSGPVYELWKLSRQWSLESFYEIYDWLSIKFDQYFFESELSEESQKIVDEYLAKGIFVHSEGAIGVDLNPYNLGFLILRKSDGNTLYATKDLVLARRKFCDFNIERSIYVVANEQNLHFKQVFKTLEIMGFEQAKNCFHLSYGLVVLPEGKMSSRQGTSVTFNVLRQRIDDELTPIMEKYKDDWSPSEISRTKRLLNIGSIKYGMLATDPVKDVVFNIADWLSFEGNSGPYLMYSYARTRSILRKGAEAGYTPALDNLALLSHDAEHELVRFMNDFNETVFAASKSLKPSVIAHFLFDLCKIFNRFYSHVSVLKAESSELISARLALVEAFSRMLQKGLELLGINPPERM